MGKQDYSVEVIEPEIKINENLDLQEKGWIIQRVGWAFIIAVMIAGALGIFGEGLLSKKTVNAGNVKVEYQRFFRYEVEMKLLIESGNHIQSISLPQQYLKNFRIVRFVPEPVNNNSLHNQVRFNFLPGDNHVVTVYIISKTYGTVTGALKVNETTEIKLDHLIYP